MVSVLESESTVIRNGEDIAARFSFLREKGHVISLVGGGGKSTWMYALGLCGQRLGHRVLLTTTTHVEKPPGISLRWKAALSSLVSGEHPQNNREGLEGHGALLSSAMDKASRSYLAELLEAAPSFVWAQSPEELEIIWSRGQIPVLGKSCGEEKLRMTETDVLQKAISMSGLTVVEADGSKAMPCKVPGPSEPVLPEESDIVFGVIGMSALGKPRREVCFRGTGEETRLMTVSDLAEILTSERGARKGVGEREYYAVLNQCDSEMRLRGALEICGLLKEKGYDQTIMSSFL